MNKSIIFSSSRGKAGAPKGGRVHWLTMLLPKLLRADYSIYYDYDKHNYKLCGKLGFGKKRFDEYHIIRTSKKCWRVTYCDNVTKEFEYTSYRRCEDVLDYVLFKYHKKKESEEQLKDALSLK